MPPQGTGIKNCQARTRQAGRTARIPFSGSPCRTGGNAGRGRLPPYRAPIYSRASHTGAGNGDASDERHAERRHPHTPCRQGRRLRGGQRRPCLSHRRRCRRHRRAFQFCRPRLCRQRNARGEFRSNEIADTEIFPSFNAWVSVRNSETCGGGSFVDQK